MGATPACIGVIAPVTRLDNSQTPSRGARAGLTRFRTTSRRGCYGGPATGQRQASGGRGVEPPSQRAGAE